jgi:hypothetical protein
MSWDIIVSDFPRAATKVADIPKDFRSNSLGSRDEIIKKIQQIIPTSNFSEPSWGLIEGNGWSIEVSLGDKLECHDFSFHVRGGDEAVFVIAAILDHMDLRALDCQTGEFFSPGSEALASFKKWREYRNRCVDGSQ